MEPCVVNDEVSDCLCRSCRLHSDLARVTDERNTARSEVARLTAEVEAMRGVVEAARPVATGDGHPSVMRSRLAAQLIALDALRTRKAPDHACVTTPDGDCIADGPCMHRSPPTKADSYFTQAKKVAAEVGKWPEWKKAGFTRKVGE